MKKTTIRIYTALLVLVMLVCFPTTTYAYFDPGTGSMLLQMLGVAFIAMSGFFFAFKTRIQAFFGRKKKGTDEDEDLDDQDDAEERAEAEQSNEDTNSSP